MNAPMSVATLKRGGCGCGGSCGCGGQCGGACGCGAVCQTETMIRPRFFAGQLLTEDDLQQLQDYVIAKNRLHNRHLFGAGVVCGLEVVCDPCGAGQIWVRPGYALDCCGNDLVLACRTRLDVNAMIRDLLRDQRGGQDCGDPCTREAREAAAKRGEAPLREYCLTIRYCEQETDPVSPYATDAPCSPQVCEPSRVREGLRFALRCPAEPSPPDDFFAALRHCFSDVIKLEKIGTEAERGSRTTDLQGQLSRGLAALRLRSFEEVRRLLLDLIDRSPHPTACTLRERVLKISKPEPASQQLKGGTTTVTEQRGVEALITIFLELLRECLCMAFLPPCDPCDDMEVELACIRVQGCEVVEICNLSRRFVLSPAALRYWLGFGRLERELQLFCCPDDECSPTKGSTQPETRAANASPRPAPAMLEQGAIRAGLVVEDLVRAMAILTSDHAPEAARLDHIGTLIGQLSGREPPEPEAEDTTIRDMAARIKGLEAQVNGLLTKAVPTSDMAPKSLRGGPPA